MSTTATPARKGKPAKQVKVRITRQAGHRHAGELHAHGAVISVSEQDARIIVEHLKAGEPVEGK